MVRRLVEEQEIGTAGECPRKRGARQLAAGERAQGPIEIVLRETEPAHRGGRAVAPGPTTRVLEPGLSLRVAPERRVLVGAFCHRLLERSQLVLHREQVTRPAQRILAERDVELERRTLVVQRDPCALRERELAALERRLARDRPQKRRLPGAVGARERQPVAPADREGDPLEKRIARELLA